MKRKYLLILLASLTVVGALFVALASNMFFSDVGNMSGGSEHSTVFVTVAASGVAITFGLALLYLIRVSKHKEAFHRITRLYLILAIVFNGIAVIADFMTVGIYGTFVSTHPFPGFQIIFLLLSLCFIGGAIYGLLRLKKSGIEDKERVHINFGYVMKTAGWFLFIMLLLNRVGMFLGMPGYVYLRNFGKTFPFYLYLLMPAFLGSLEVLFVLKISNKKLRLLLTYIALGLNVCFFAYIAVMGISDTAFISSLSPAMPLERLASKPLELLIHFLAYTGVGVALIIQNVKAKEE